MNSKLQALALNHSTRCTLSSQQGGSRTFSSSAWSSPCWPWPSTPAEPSTSRGGYILYLQNKLHLLNSPLVHTFYRAIFLTDPPSSVPKWEKANEPTRGSLSLSDEGFHRTAAPVGLLALFHFGTEQGGGVVKNHHVQFFSFCSNESSPKKWSIWCQIC